MQPWKAAEYIPRQSVPVRLFLESEVFSQIHPHLMESVPEWMSERDPDGRDPDRHAERHGLLLVEFGRRDRKLPNQQTEQKNRQIARKRTRFSFETEKEKSHHSADRDREGSDLKDVTDATAGAERHQEFHIAAAHEFEK